MQIVGVIVLLRIHTSCPDWCPRTLRRAGLRSILQTMIATPDLSGMGQVIQRGHAPFKLSSILRPEKAYSCVAGFNAVTLLQMCRIAVSS